MLSFILFVLSLPSLITLILLPISVFVDIPNVERKWWRHQLLVAYDQWVNACFLGWADESISSRIYRNSITNPKSFWIILHNAVDKLFFWESDHCFHSFQAERERSQLPPELRG